jgi:hypothetical protein
MDGQQQLEIEEDFEQSYVQEDTPHVINDNLMA